MTDIIQAAELDEANLWLRRTRWGDYLQGLDRNWLFTSIMEPEVEADQPK
jgi:hypothetical protein